jgi:feruloyl-CoA synthase
MAPDLNPFAPVDLRVERRDDGVVLLQNTMPLESLDDTLIDRLRHWAERTPDSLFLAERAGDGWRRLSYADVISETAMLARRLLGLGLGPERPLIILAPNSLDHALIALAAMRIGVPPAVVSVAYATSVGQVDKFRNAVETLTPGAVYFDGPKPLAEAIRDAAPGVVLLSRHGDEGGRTVDDLALAPIADLAAAAAEAAVGPETIAKFLFTSGSTGSPKAVPNTHRMMCASMDGVGQVWPFLRRRPPVLVDWLPWSHTFGGNFCFTMALVHGGAYYIDGGKPTPALIATTVETLKAISPALYLSVPGGYEALLPFLEADEAWAARFFGGLDILFNAGSAMPSSTRARLEALVARVRATPLPMVSSWGSTETAPSCTAVYFPSRHAQNIGLPLPGVTVKLTPNSGRLEMRVKGPNVMKGYWRKPSEAAFDEDGFYRMGDAGRFIDEDNPECGLLFDGRVAENFKLSSGTWVHVGPLRLAAISAAQPLVSDVVVTGHDRHEIGLMVFPNVEACRGRLSDGAGALTAADLAAHPDLIDALTSAFAAHNQEGAGSSARIARFIVLGEPPRLEFGEITDKGYLNQRAILERRAALVDHLHAAGHDVSSRSRTADMAAR